MNTNLNFIMCDKYSVEIIGEIKSHWDSQIHKFSATKKFLKIFLIRRKNLIQVKKINLSTARFLKIFAKMFFVIFMCFALFMLSVRIQWWPLITIKKSKKSKKCKNFKETLCKKINLSKKNVLFSKFHPISAYKWNFLSQIPKFNH